MKLPKPSNEGMVVVRRTTRQRQNPAKVTNREGPFRMGEALNTLADPRKGRSHLPNLGQENLTIAKRKG